MSTPATRRLSRAVRPMKTDFSSVTNVRPWRARRYSGAVVAVPPSSTSPDSSGSSPASDSSVVVLPGTVGTEQPDDLARLHDEVDVVDDRLRSVAGRDRPGLEGGGAAGAVPLSRTDGSVAHDSPPAIGASVAATSSSDSPR